MTQLTNKKYVLYHANCADGMAAAWAAWKILGTDATYLPCNYGDKDIPIMDHHSQVFLVDFTYPREMLKEMAETRLVIVLDHHKTAAADLVSLPVVEKYSDITGVRGLYVNFDMNRSGAKITWDYFHAADKEVPKLIQYVQDRDLWKWELPFSKEISAYIAAEEWSIENFQVIAEQLEEFLPAAVTIGQSLLSAQNQTVDMMAEFGKVFDTIFGKCALINATAYWSELGNRLLDKFPDADFSLSYFYDETKGTYKFSARSKAEFDVTTMAKGFGGGGHKNAAGFTTTKEIGDTFLSRIRLKTQQIESGEWDGNTTEV